MCTKLVDKKCWQLTWNKPVIIKPEQALRTLWDKAWWLQGNKNTQQTCCKLLKQLALSLWIKKSCQSTCSKPVDNLKLTCYHQAGASDANASRYRLEQTCSRLASFWLCTCTCVRAIHAHTIACQKTGDTACLLWKSNPRPLECQSNALPTELQSGFFEYVIFRNRVCRSFYIDVILNVAQLAEHRASIPKFVGSIPTKGDST